MKKREEKIKLTSFHVATIMLVVIGILVAIITEPETCMRFLNSIISSVNVILFALLIALLAGVVGYVAGKIDKRKNGVEW